MGRVVRYVPPNWKHPKDKDGKLIPIEDRTLEDAMEEWNREYETRDKEEDTTGELFIEDYAPPTKYADNFRPEWDTEPTWIQIYENVSEGTPVSPAFATENELRAWLCKNGDYWSASPPTADAVDKLLSTGYAPTGMIVYRGNEAKAYRWDEDPDADLVADSSPRMSARKCMARTRSGVPCQNRIAEGKTRCGANHTPRR